MSFALSPVGGLVRVMSQRKFEWYAGLVCVGLLVGCAATPVNHEELDAHPHGELSLAGEQIPSTFSREGEFLVSPVLGEDGGITRVGSLVGLRGDAMTGPALEARWVDAQGEKGDWRPLHATWSEPGQTVWILDFSRPVLGAQLRLPVDETADIQWMLLNATLPADPSLAYEDDAEHPELFEYRSLPEIEGLVTRERWRARPTRCSSQNRAKRRMAVHYTVTPSGGDLAARVRGIQRYHMDNLGWCDIGYHFLVGVDGSIFEGRPLPPWLSRRGA